uniref:Uncharacterized protein n=1 Tax=Zea mays TaxID=4577 RepID=B8A118_MAIZE|nr:unknown [Zea mays]
MAADSARLWHVPFTIPLVPSASKTRTRTRPSESAIAHVCVYCIEQKGRDTVTEQRTLVLDDVAPLVGDALGGLLSGLGGEDEQAVVVADHVAEQRPVAAALGHAPGGEHVAREARRVEHPGEPHGRLHVVLHEDGHHLGGVPRQEALHLAEHVHRRLKRGEVLADAAVGVAEPDVVAEVVHVQHQTPHAVLHDRSDNLS